MPFLIFAVASCALVWLIVGFSRQWFRLAWLGSIPLLAATTIFAGSVFGYDFFNVKIGPIPLTIDRVLWAALMTQFVLWLFLRYIRPKNLDSLDWIIALLFLVLSVSTVLHDYSYRDNLPLSRLLFFNFMPIGIYFVTKHSDISNRQIKWILVSFVAFGAYLSFTSIAEWQGWNTLVFPGYITSTDFVEFLGRGRGPFLNPVACGIFQVICMSAAVLLFPKASVRWRIGLTLLMPLFLGQTSVFGWKVQIIEKKIRRTGRNRKSALGFVPITMTVQRTDGAFICEVRFLIYSKSFVTCLLMKLNFRVQRQR